VVPTSTGQALLAVLVAVVGYALDRRTRRVEVLVNGRLSAALDRITELELEIEVAAGLKPAGSGADVAGPTAAASRRPLKPPVMP
jgi:hypothetical protein